MLWITFSVFVQVDLNLEVSVVTGDQGISRVCRQGIGAQQPILRIMLGQSPAHDIQAFIEHLLTGTQYRNRAFGRQGQQLGRLGLEADLTDVHRALTVTQRQARTHGPRAAAERVENHPLTSTVLKPLP
ncbi:hypothetical protein D3C72_1258400 [compost metagenome]